MSGLINDFLRTLIAYGIRVTGLTSRNESVCRIPSSSTTTTREYAIDEQTPVLSYGREIIALINQAAAGLDDQVQFALTSGSTGSPKRILFAKVGCAP